MRWPVAVAIAALVVVVAVVAGLAAAAIGRPAPTPLRVSVTPSPTVIPSPTPADPAVLFKQPVSAACGTTDSVFVVTNGGGIMRYDGTSWSIVDNTLRSLTAVTCARSSAVAVGLVGSIVIIDELQRQIHSTDVTVDDFHGVAALADGALMVGTRGTVFILAGNDIQPFASGIDEGLNDVVAFSQTSAWVVGDAGITYRLDQRGWQPIGTSQTKTLRAVAATTAANAVAVGDDGVIVRYDGGWKPVESGATAKLNDVIVDPTVWIAGDHGTLLTGTLASLRAIDLRTECDLISVFAHGSDVWVLGRIGAGGGGAWRLSRDGAVQQHWGGC